VAGTIGGRRHLVFFLEQLDEVRGVGERAFVADFRNLLRGGNQQQARVHETLTDIPLVGRHLEVAPEFLFERGERTVGQLRQLLDGYVLENVVVDDLLEVFLGGVYVAQQLAFDAAVFVRGNQIDQFGHLDVLGRFVVVEILVAQVVVGVGEKIPDASPCGHGYVHPVAAVFAGVRIGDVQPVGDVQVQQDALEVRRRVVDKNLLEGLAVFGEMLDVVVADSEVENVASGELAAFVAVVDEHGPPQHVANGISRQGL